VVRAAHVKLLLPLLPLLLHVSEGRDEISFVFAGLLPAWCCERERRAGFLAAVRRASRDLSNGLDHAAFRNTYYT
jgi:hypothetical protein